MARASAKAGGTNGGTRWTPNQIWTLITILRRRLGHRHAARQLQKTPTACRVMLHKLVHGEKGDAAMRRAAREVSRSTMPSADDGEDEDDDEDEDEEMEDDDVSNDGQEAAEGEDMEEAAEHDALKVAPSTHRTDDIAMHDGEIAGSALGEEPETVPYEADGTGFQHGEMEVTEHDSSNIAPSNHRTSDAPMHTGGVGEGPETAPYEAHETGIQNGGSTLPGTSASSSTHSAPEAGSDDSKPDDPRNVARLVSTLMGLWNLGRDPRAVEYVTTSIMNCRPAFVELDPVQIEASIRLMRMEYEAREFDS